MKLHRSMLCEPVQTAHEMHLSLEISQLAAQLGLSDEDLEMIQALGNESVYSAEAMESRWTHQKQQHLSVVA